MNTLAERIAAAPLPPQVHAIFAGIVGFEPKTNCRYTGKASVTSDGFVMCNFVDACGSHHMGSFVGDMTQITETARLLKNFGHVKPDEYGTLDQLIKDWIAVDYR